MSDAKPEGRAASAYKRFRGSSAFVGALSTFVIVWLVTHFATGFDPEWGGLNLILSIESSIGMALFMMVADRQEAFQRKQTEYMLHLLEAQHALIEAAITKTTDPEK